MVIFGYARVSTIEQSETHALEQQIDRLRRYGAIEIFCDVQSRTTTDRKEYNRLLRIIESDLHPDLTVVITRFDRLGTIVPIHVFVTAALAHNVNIVALDEQIDLSTPAGRLHVNILGAVSQMYVEDLSLKTAHGHAFRRSKELPYHVVFGLVRNGDLVELDKQPFISTLDGKEWSRFDIARWRIETLVKTGSLNRTIVLYNQCFGQSRPPGVGRGNRAQRGGLVLTPGGFATWISNPMLRGHIAYRRKNACNLSHQSKWDVRLNKHEPIMLDSEWEFIERMLAGNIKRKDSFGASVSRPLAGLVRCGCCGGGCSAVGSLRADGSKKYSHRCVTYVQGRGCESKMMVREDKLLDYVNLSLTNYAAEIISLEPTNTKSLVNPEIAKLESQLADLKKIPSPIAPILTAISDIETQINQIRIQSDLSSKSLNNSFDELITVFKDPLFWTEYLAKKLSPSEMRGYYSKWIKVIWIKDGQITGIEFNF